MPDSPQPNEPERDGPETSAGGEAPQRPEADLPQPTYENEPTTTRPERQTGSLPLSATTQRSWFSRHGAVALYVGLVLAIAVVLGLGAQQGAKLLISAVRAASDNQAAARSTPKVDRTQQAAAEHLLERLASGDLDAAGQVVAQSPNWTGRTRRTKRAIQFLDTAINSNDLRIREAALHAFLALDGIRQDETGRAMLENAAGDPGQRAWALWLLGALGHLGVDPVHAAKTIESYLDDPVIDVRVGAVSGLQLLATDETIPMLLDRFRNDPSPVVQERAICGLAQSGMYSHGQRLLAAQSLVGWLDDGLLTTQQHTWALQALHDIAGGASPGSDSAAAWRDWWSENGRR